jgi:hypothetical protein
MMSQPQISDQGYLEPVTRLINCHFCQLERYYLPFRVDLHSVVHLFFIYLSYYSGLAY